MVLVIFALLTSTSIVEIAKNESFLENFEKDRNVILKTTQQQLFKFLSGYLVKVTLDKFSVHFNPLGLIDDTYQRILDYQYDNTETLKEIYENLCVAYRYKHGDNQLEIIWDGTSHEEKYKIEWIDTFEIWANDLTDHHGFIKAILQLTVFKEENSNTFFVQNYAKGIINEYFEIKVLKRNGIKKVVVKTRPHKKAS